MTEQAVPPPPSDTPPPEAAPPYIQLTQARVPLDEADEAFGVPDATGRHPDRPVAVGAEPHPELVPRCRDHRRHRRADPRRDARAARRPARRGRPPGVPRGVPLVHRAGARRFEGDPAAARAHRPDDRPGQPRDPAVDRGLAPRHDARDPVRRPGQRGADPGRPARLGRRAADLPDHASGTVRVRDLCARFRPGLPGGRSGRAAAC